MQTGSILLETRSERITEINIDGIIGIPEASPGENPTDRPEARETFQRQLEAIRNIATPQIVVNIRSTGGNVDDGLLIHDMLCESGKQITTRCYGYVASAATLIAQAASKGRREMSANGLYLIHQSVACGEGNVGSLEQTVDLLNQTDRRIAALYASRSGKADEHFARLMGLNHGNGKWLCAQEAKAAGLIDRIIPSRTISNEARQAVRMLNLPALPENPDRDQAGNAVKRMFKRLLETIGWSPGEKGQEIVIAVRPSAGSGEEPEKPEIQPQPQTTDSVTEAARPLALPVNRSQNSPTEDHPLRLQAVATSTEPKEDPSQDEPLLSPNTRSYQQDIRQFTL